MKLNAKAFALTCGLVWGIGLMLITWWIMLMDGATGEITFIGKVYRGYSISFGGSFMGLVWGLIDGAIGGAILAGIYNYFAGRFSR
ncbi:MAG: bacteriophage holin [Candidatus Marinimicrobia bacterium]|nr:bacteriophage holin [Candidatus Neomarinimicrobiota bacterium]